MAKSTSKPAGKAGTTSGTGNDTTKAAQPASQGSGATSMAALGGAMGLGTGQSAVEALKQDHRRVEALFSQFESASDGHRKEELVAMICTELNIHTRLEEEIFYPACQEEIDDEDLMDEAQVEHDAAKFLIADLLQASCEDPYYDAKVKALKEQIRHHVAEEEKAGEGVFAKAQAEGVDTPRLAAELAERKQELQRRGTRLQPTRAVSFDLDLRNMIGNGGGDGGRGREDERRYGGSRGGWEAARRRMGMERHGYRDEGDDHERGSRGGWFGRSEGGARRDWDQRDTRGGGGSERDDWRGTSRSGRDRDDDRERYERREEPGSRGGHGGWYGDPEGHARAARRRWEEQDDDRRGRDWSRRR